MQSNDVGTAEQTVALERLRSALERLEQLLAGEEQASAEFNLFELLNQHRREEAHSRVLTWLLNPGENHGIGDYFLKSFLLATGCHLDFGDNSNWSQARSEREWKHEIDGTRGSLDILVVDESKRFLCAIENKVFFGEHSEQLTRYRKALEERYPDYGRQHIFLSPTGTVPYLETEQEYWTPMTYAVILESVEKTVDNDTVEMSEDIRVFLRHYANTVRRIVVPESTKIQQLAREIYLEHRDAVERVLTYKPKYREEIKQRLEEVINERDDWTLVRPYDDPEFVSFQPDVLENFKVFRRSAADYNRLLWFGFGLSKEGKAWFQIELAPIRNKAVRGRVVETIRQHKRLFRSEKEYDNGAVRLHESDWLLEDTDLGARWDAGVVRDKVNQFASNEFPSILEVIVNCLRRVRGRNRTEVSKSARPSVPSGNSTASACSEWAKPW